MQRQTQLILQQQQQDNNISIVTLEHDSIIVDMRHDVRLEQLIRNVVSD